MALVVSWLWCSSAFARVSKPSRRRGRDASYSRFQCGLRILFVYSPACAQIVTAWISASGPGVPGPGYGCPAEVAVNPVTNKIYVPVTNGIGSAEMKTCYTAFWR